MGVKIVVPAFGYELLNDNIRPHRIRIPVEDYVWNAYSGMGQYICGQYKHLSEEIKRMKQTWKYVLRKAKFTWLLFL